MEQQIEQIVTNLCDGWLAEDMCLAICGYGEYNMQNIEKILAALRNDSQFVELLYQSMDEETLRLLYKFISDLKL